MDTLASSQGAWHAGTQTKLSYSCPSLLPAWLPGGVVSQPVGGPQGEGQVGREAHSPDRRWMGSDERIACQLHPVGGSLEKAGAVQGESSRERNGQHTHVHCT